MLVFRGVAKNTQRNCSNAWSLQRNHGGTSKDIGSFAKYFLWISVNGMIRKYYTFTNLFDVPCPIFKTPIATHSQPSRFFFQDVFLKQEKNKGTSRNIIIKHQTLSASTKSFTGSQIRDSMSVSKPQFSWRTIPRTTRLDDFDPTEFWDPSRPHCQGLLQIPPEAFPKAPCYVNISYYIDYVIHGCFFFGSKKKSCEKKCLH